MDSLTQETTASIIHTGQDSVVEAVAAAPQEDAAIKVRDTKEMVTGGTTTTVTDAAIKAVVPVVMKTNPITTEIETTTIRTTRITTTATPAPTPTGIGIGIGIVAFLRNGAWGSYFLQIYVFTKISCTSSTH